MFGYDKDLEDKIDEGVNLYDKGEYAKALEIFEMVAAKGYPRGWSNLAKAYHEGKGVPKNDLEVKRFFDLIKASADQDHAIAQFHLGWMYQEGWGVTQDDAEAVRWYRLSAEQGFAVAQHNLGWMYEEGRGGAESDAESDVEAVRWYRLSAEQGFAAAQFNLGWMYEEGRGGAESDAEAVRWYRLSAEQGFAVAQHNLGWMYQEGRGVAQNDAEAVRWYRLSAEQGFAVAQKNLGELMLLVEADYGSAQKYLQLALQGGMKVASCYLGILRTYGLIEGGSVDPLVSQRYYQTAADIDYPLAWVLLSISQVENKESRQSISECLRKASQPSDFYRDKDYRLELELFECLSDRGQVKASLVLAAVYEHGLLGVKSDKARALGYYDKACKQNGVDIPWASEQAMGLRKEMATDAQTFAELINQQLVIQLKPTEFAKTEEIAIQIVAQVTAPESDALNDKEDESRTGLSIKFTDCPNYLAKHPIPSVKDKVAAEQLKDTVISELKVQVTRDESETSTYHKTGEFSLKDVFNGQLVKEVPSEKCAQVRRQQRQAQVVCERLVGLEIEQQQDIGARLKQAQVELDAAEQKLEEADAQARLRDEPIAQDEVLENGYLHSRIQTALAKLTQRVTTLEDMVGSIQKVVGSLQLDLDSLSHKADYLDAKQVNERLLQQREREGKRRLLLCQREILDGDEAVAQYYLYLRTYLRGFLLGIGAGCSPLVKLDSKAIADLLPLGGSLATVAVKMAVNMGWLAESMAGSAPLVGGAVKALLSFVKLCLNKHYQSTVKHGQHLFVHTQEAAERTLEQIADETSLILAFRYRREIEGDSTYVTSLTPEEAKQLAKLTLNSIMAGTLVQAVKPDAMPETKQIDMDELRSLTWFFVTTVARFPIKTCKLDMKIGKMPLPWKEVVRNKPASFNGPSVAISGADETKKTHFVDDEAVHSAMSKACSMRTADSIFRGRWARLHCEIKPGETTPSVWLWYRIDESVDNSLKKRVISALKSNKAKHVLRYHGIWLSDSGRREHEQQIAEDKKQSQKKSEERYYSRWQKIQIELPLSQETGWMVRAIAKEHTAGARLSDALLDPPIMGYLNVAITPREHPVLWIKMREEIGARVAWGLRGMHVVQVRREPCQADEINATQVRIVLGKRLEDIEGLYQANTLERALAEIKKALDYCCGLREYWHIKDIVTDNDKHSLILRCTLPNHANALQALLGDALHLRYEQLQPAPIVGEAAEKLLVRASSTQLPPSVFNSSGPTFLRAPQPVNQNDKGKEEDRPAISLNSNQE